MDFSAGLNPQQQQAMQAGTGPVLVSAGPGSGKTRVLTRRIAYLIHYLGVKPGNILAVTFTNKAAKEMQARVESLLGGPTRGLTLGTFHGVCARILRREAEHLPFDNNFVIFDQDDQRGLVKQAIKEMNLDPKRYRPNSVHASISNAKNELILPDDFPLQTYRDEIVQRVYVRYQEMLMNSNAVDFDDLLLWAAHLMDNFPDVREKYARRYEHVLVDEFQDTNLAQYNLIKHLAGFHRNIFAVGDTDQSIYRWRGADYRNLQRFQEDFPDSVTILLEQNYRSTQHILDTAMAVIQPNNRRTVKSLFTDRGRGDKITLQETFDGREEGGWIVQKISMLIAGGHAEPGECAIMYRTNAQSRLLEEAFLQANLPYKLVGAQRFYGRREVKDVMCYLRLVQNPSDEASLLRVINTPRRKIGNKTVVGLRTLALQETTNMGAIILAMAKGDNPYVGTFSAGAGRALTGFAHLLAGWQSVKDELSPLKMMDKVLSDSNYQNHVDDGSEEGIDRWDNVLELRRLASEYEDRTLTEFLENVALVSDQDTMDTATNVPTLLTLHAAKGLEFNNVFISGLEDGTLPHIRSFDDPEGMAEERRLFYVGITRAKDRLFLVHALNRANYGYTEPTDPSRFLDDIPDDSIEGGNPLGVVMTRRTQKSRADLWDNHTTSAPIIEPSYISGQNVRHPTWGDGMVLNTTLEDGEEIVDVFFEEVGLKKLIASLAKLEVVE